MSNPNIIELTGENFEAEVLQATVPVLVDFWAPWCGPCRMIAPIIDEIASEAGERFKICKLNVDDAGEIAAQYKVLTIPTLLLFKDGQVAQTQTGARPKADILAMLG